MSSTLILRIPEPCNEDWDNMSPTDNGRHCDSCSHELIDFTKWSDSRIVAYLEQHSGKICGLLSSRQLNRNLLPAMQTAPSYNGLSLPALVLLAVTMTTNMAHAGQRMDPIPPFSLMSLAETPKDTIWGKFRHSGVVVDKETGDPIPFAKVSVSALALVVSSDVDGRFTLEFSARSPNFTLTIESPGFDTLSVAVNAQTAAANTIYELTWPTTEELHLIGSVVLTKKQMRSNRRANRKAERATSRKVTKTE